MLDFGGQRHWDWFAGKIGSKFRPYHFEKAVPAEFRARPVQRRRVKPSPGQSTASGSAFDGAAIRRWMPTDPVEHCRFLWRRAAMLSSSLTGRVVVSARRAGAARLTRLFSAATEVFQCRQVPSLVRPGGLVRDQGLPNEIVSIRRRHRAVVWRRLDCRGSEQKIQERDLDTRLKQMIDPCRSHDFSTSVVPSGEVARAITHCHGSRVRLLVFVTADVTADSLR